MYAIVASLPQNMYYTLITTKFWSYPEIMDGPKFSAIHMNQAIV